jgi:hypothetical protein
VATTATALGWIGAGSDGVGYGRAVGIATMGIIKCILGAPEIAGDGVDNNCDYMIDMDVDNDGGRSRTGTAMK